jgi:3-oxoacyl-[acyl-carrier protein] reductase
MDVAEQTNALGIDEQVILVTGAGKNLGRAIAIGAGLRGARIAVNIRSDVASAAEVVAQIRESGSQAISLPGDVANADDVERMVDTCAARLGPISTVIHCAAFRSHQPMHELTYDEWKRTLSVSLGGAYLLARSTVPTMASAGFGRLVFIAGSSIVSGLPTGCVHVATAKSALRGFVRSLVQEVGARGVSANVVSPGPIDFGRHQEIAPMGRWDPVRASSLGRMATADELAELCLFLCSPAAAIIQGQTIMADGGVFGFGD